MFLWWTPSKALIDFQGLTVFANYAVALFYLQFSDRLKENSQGHNDVIKKLTRCKTNILKLQYPHGFLHSALKRYTPLVQDEPMEEWIDRLKLNQKKSKHDLDKSKQNMEIYYLDKSGHNMYKSKHDMKVQNMAWTNQNMTRTNQNIRWADQNLTGQINTWQGQISTWHGQVKTWPSSPPWGFQIWELDRSWTCLNLCIYCSILQFLDQGFDLSRHKTESAGICAEKLRLNRKGFSIIKYSENSFCMSKPGGYHLVEQFVDFD